MRKNKDVDEKGLGCGDKKDKGVGVKGTGVWT
jgi:hypothetical protein